MKEFRLSTPLERIASVSFVAVILAAFGLLLYALRNQIGLMIVCSLGVALISVLLIVYVINVTKAACIVNLEEKTMTVRGVKEYTVDLSEAVLLQTIARKGGQATIRVLIFSDAEEKIIASIPTMFSFKQGIQAEPMAKEMAAVLGIDFQQNVPEWQYDKEKYKEHLKEEAEREKKEAKERRKNRICLLFPDPGDRLIGGGVSAEVLLQEHQDPEA